MRWRSPPETDDEYIERIRKLVSWYDRWKWLAAPLVAVIAVAPVAMAIILANSLVGFINRMGNNANAQLIWAGVAGGVIMGAGLGQVLHSALAQLQQLFTGQRTERLLLRYYDAFHSSLEETAPASDDDVQS